MLFTPTSSLPDAIHASLAVVKAWEALTEIFINGA
jgi:hypothetical protein